MGTKIDKSSSCYRQLAHLFQRAWEKVIFVIRLFLLNNPLRVLSLFISLYRGKTKTYYLNFGLFSCYLRSESADLRTAFHSSVGEFEGLKRYLSQEKISILDAGAHIGTSALALASYFPNSLIVCVEPNLENYKLLLNNTKHLDAVIVRHGALVSDEEINEIELHDPGSGSWGYTTEKTENRKSTALYRVPCFNINRIEESLGVSHFDFIKIDIEGGELELMKFPDWIERTPAILIELHTRFYPEIESIFNDVTLDRRNITNLGQEKILSLRN